MKKLMLALSTALLFISPVLTLSACKKDEITEIKKEDEIVSVNDWANHLAKSKLISRSLVISREEKWSPEEVLQTALEDKDAKLSQYFEKPDLIEKVLTAEHSKFSKPEHWVAKGGFISGFILGKINDLYKDNNDTNFFGVFKDLVDMLSSPIIIGAIKTQVPKIQILFDILEGKENGFIDVFVKGLKENQKLIDKSYSDIFKNFSIPFGKLFKKIEEIREHKKKTNTLEKTEPIIKEVINELPKILFPMIAFFKEITDRVVSLNHENESQKTNEFSNLLEKKYTLDGGTISKLVKNLKDIYDKSDENRAGLRKNKLFEIITNPDLPFNSLTVIVPHFNLEDYILGDDIGEKLALLDNTILSNFDKLFNKLTNIKIGESVILKLQTILHDAKNFLSLIEMANKSEENLISDKDGQTALNDLFDEENQKYSWIIQKFIVDGLNTEEKAAFEKLSKNDNTWVFLKEKIKALKSKTWVIRISVLNKILLELGYDSSKQNFNSDSVLEIFKNILKEDFIKDLLQKKENWNQLGDYVKDFINNTAVIKANDENISRDYSTSKITTSYDVILNKTKKYKFIWEFIYKNKKLVTMKIVNFYS